MKPLSILTLTLALLAVAALGCDSNDLVDVNEPAVRSNDLVDVNEPAVRSELPGSVAGTSPHLAALQELQSAFHGALRNSDSEALRSLWTDDATVQVGGNSASGPEAITEFFEGVAPFVNGWASLAPTYKTQFEIQGNRAEYAFECVYVEETGLLTGNEVLAHLNATGTMRKVGNRWLFESFQGGAGPLP